jgi:hypothetical protein
VRFDPFWTLFGNGLNKPVQAAVDGQPILVTNQNGNSVSLWNATADPDDHAKL